MRKCATVCHAFKSRKLVDPGDYNEDCLTVFQENERSWTVDIYDVEDAFMACEKLDEQASREYCACIGINYDRAVKYYDTVLSLNALLRNDTSCQIILNRIKDWLS